MEEGDEGLCSTLDLSALPSGPIQAALGHRRPGGAGLEQGH